MHNALNFWALLRDWIWAGSYTFSHWRRMPLKNLKVYFYRFILLYSIYLYWRPLRGAFVDAGESMSVCGVTWLQHGFHSQWAKYGTKPQAQTWPAWKCTPWSSYCCVSVCMPIDSLYTIIFISLYNFTLHHRLSNTEHGGGLLGFRVGGDTQKSESDVRVRFKTGGDGKGLCACWGCEGYQVIQTSWL